MNNKRLRRLDLMLWFRRLIWVLLTLTTFAFIIDFMLSNTQKIQLVILGYQLNPFSCSVICIASILIGGTLGLLIASIRIAQLRFINARLRTQLEKYNKKVQ